MRSSGKETLRRKKKSSHNFNSLLAWIVQCQMKEQESHKAQTLQHGSSLPGSCPCYFIMARGLWGKQEQKGKKKDDL